MQCGRTDLCVLLSGRDGYPCVCGAEQLARISAVGWVVVRASKAGLSIVVWAKPAAKWCHSSFDVHDTAIRAPNIRLLILSFLPGWVKLYFPTNRFYLSEPQGRTTRDN